MLNSLTLRCHDYMTPNRFYRLKMSTNLALFGPSGAGNYRSSICCNSCRGHKWSLGVSIRSCLEKSCVSKRHCPLTDIYLPLSLLFLFFFLALPFFFPLYLIFFLLSLRLGAKSLHCSQEPLQKTGWNLRLLDEPERVPLCPSASGALFQVEQLLLATERRTGTRTGTRTSLFLRVAKRRVEMRRRIMKTWCVWAPLLLLPLTSVVSWMFLWPSSLCNAYQFCVSAAQISTNHIQNVSDSESISLELNWIVAPSCTSGSSDPDFHL